MAFVKLDCGILDSTLWVDRAAREVFVTALLMAQPYELTEEVEQYQIESLELTGWKVPPGWYGFVAAASIGIIRRAGIEEEVGMQALVRLGNPEAGSRSPDFEGRRLVRIEGGFIILNFQKYRDRDYTAADRARRYRARKSGGVTRDMLDDTRDDTGASRDITQAEAEAEAEGKKNKDRSGEPSPVQYLFGIWQETYNHPHSKLDDKRKKKIEAALKLGYSLAQLASAIQGYKYSKFHMGQNDRNTVYDSLDLMLRGAEQIDKGLQYYEEGRGGGNGQGTDSDPWNKGPSRGIHS